MPSLESLVSYFKEKPFVLLAIDLQEDRETVQRYMRSKGLTFTNMLDSDGRVAGLYGVSSTPVKFVIDPQGNMAGAALGYREWDKQEVKALIELLMEKRQ